MKRNGFRILTSLFAVAMLGLPVLQAGSEHLIATIPFDFIIGETTLPAGQYTLSGMSQAALVVRSEDRKSTAMVITMGVKDKSSNGQPRLVFNRYGNKHFLSKVWSGYDSTGRQIRQSSQEREFALNQTSDTVTLVAQAR